MLSIRTDILGDRSHSWWKKKKKKKKKEKKKKETNKNNEYYKDTENIVNIFAVCTYRYVISLGLWSKYDVHDHYFRFIARILANPLDYILFSLI